MAWYCHRISIRVEGLGSSRVLGSSDSVLFRFRVFAGGFDETALSGLRRFIAFVLSDETPRRCHKTHCMPCAQALNPKPPKPQC